MYLILICLVNKSTNYLIFLGLIMHKIKSLGFYSLFAIIILFLGCATQKEVTNKIGGAGEKTVVLGVENFLQNYLDLVKGKKVGLLTNPSGVDRKLRSTADQFFKHPDIKLTALFGPEHGIRGAIYAGEKYGNEIDPQTKLPVFSLYGENRKPTAEMLQNVDVLMIDIQDIGIRAYTFIYTMAKVMEAAAEFHKEVIVLDRPNPIGGIAVEGNLVHKGFFSFVGMYPIPYRHGMTIGELAKLFNEAFNINCELTVIPMLNWKRNMFWDDTKLPWVPTSPHVPHWETALFMSATGVYGELRTISEGVGYTLPFEILGEPWIDGYALAVELNKLKMPGVIFRPLYYKPYYATFAGEVCQGVQLHIIDRNTFNSYVTGLHMISTIMKLYPEHDLFAKEDRISAFCKVAGCDYIMNDLKAGLPVSEIQAKWQAELKDFKKLREQYLLY
jgi:uncharacterized protein YbbC (DUF1343 family)